MKDIVIRVGGTPAEICAERSGNVVPLRRPIGRTVAAGLPTRHSPATSTSENGAPLSEAAAAVPEEPPVYGIFESTEMIWRNTPQRLPAAALTVVFATSGRSMIAHAGANYLWFDIAWEDDRLRATGPVERTGQASTQLPSVALIWFERFLLAGPRLTVGEHGMTLSGPSAEVTFTAAQELSAWCVVAPVRLQC
jgi:pyruvate/2-oxoglutarate dehydrogenase complex dihydrolipoamide acyltransferase (E2) component